MDVSVKISEKKSIVVGPFGKNETEFLLSGSNISDSIILSGNNNEKYDVYKMHYCMSGSEHQESNTFPIISENYDRVTSCEAANYLETFVNEANDTKQMPITCSLTVLNTLEANRTIKSSGMEIVSSGTYDEKSASILEVTSKIASNGGALTNETERVDKASINCSETNVGLTFCSEKTNELLITSNEITETSSKESSKAMCLSNIMEGENIVMKTGTNTLLQIVYEIEKFFDAIDSTNKDMQKKSGILLQKHNLVDEIISYTHAVQSIIRLSTFRSLFIRNIPKYSMAINPHKPFYESGEHILEELTLYRSELQADFNVWETYRKEILEISDQMLYDFEYCKEEMAAKVLMHDISTKICKILKRMEAITSKREEKNENYIYLMDSVDTYIRYSNVFIIDDTTLTSF